MPWLDGRTEGLRDSPARFAEDGPIERVERLLAHGASEHRLHEHIDEHVAQRPVVSLSSGAILSVSKQACQHGATCLVKDPPARRAREGPRATHTNASEYCQSTETFLVVEASGASCDCCRRRPDLGVQEPEPSQEMTAPVNASAEHEQ